MAVRADVFSSDDHGKANVVVGCPAARWTDDLRKVAGSGQPLGIQMWDATTGKVGLLKGRLMLREGLGLGIRLPEFAVDYSLFSQSRKFTCAEILHCLYVNEFVIR